MDLSRSGRPVPIQAPKPLSEVIVKGTVAEGSDAANLIVNATAIHVKG